MVVGLGAAASSQAAARSTQPLPVLSAPVTAIPALQGGLPGGLSVSYLAGSAQSEPRVMAAPDGTVLVAAQAQARDCTTGAVVTRGFQDCVWRSTDGGRSFRISGGGQDTGSDVDFVALPSGTLMYATLANNGTLGSGFPGVAVLRSTDHGRSWTGTTLNGDLPVVDREWLVVVGKEVLLLFTAPPGNLWLSRSTDDGRTFGAPAPLSALPPELVLTAPGAPVFDAARGELVVPYEAATSATDANAYGISVSGDVTLHVARSKDRGATWTDEVVGTYAQRQGVPVVAADAKGREYLLVPTTDAKGRLATLFWRRERHASGWGAPRQLSPAGSSAYLSFLVARGDGGVAAAWLESRYPDAAGTARPWTVQLATSQDAGTTWSRQDVSRGVVYTGAQQDSAAVVFDLFGLTVDRAGMVHLAFVRQTDPAHRPNLVRVDYVRQVGGPPLGGSR